MVVKNICFQCACITLLLTGNIKSKAQAAVSTPEQITTGNQSPQIKKQYDDDALTWYTVSTDNKAIYIHISITDSLQKRKTIQNGMEVWIDIKGKKNKTTGIMFPLGSKAGVYPGGGSHIAAGGPSPFFENNTNNNKRNADSEFAQLVGRQTEMQLKGFTGMPDGKQNLQPAIGFVISLHISHDTLMYDAAIPLSNLEKLPQNKSFTIGIVEKGIQLPGFDNSMEGPDGDMGGPPPGDGGGMMPPPGDIPPGENNMRRLYETNSIWYKFKLHA